MMPFTVYWSVQLLFSVQHWAKPLEIASFIVICREAFLLCCCVKSSSLTRCFIKASCIQYFLMHALYTKCQSQSSWHCPIKIWWWQLSLGHLVLLNMSMKMGQKLIVELFGKSWSTSKRHETVHSMLLEPLTLTPTNGDTASGSTIALGCSGRLSGRKLILP